jgi:hypothetical protein
MRRRADHLYRPAGFAPCVRSRRVGTAGADRGGPRPPFRSMRSRSCSIQAGGRASTRRMLAAKADELDMTIRKLTEMRSSLRHAAACPAPSHMECPTFRRILRAAASGAIGGAQEKDCKLIQSGLRATRSWPARRGPSFNVQFADDHSERCPSCNHQFPLSDRPTSWPG